MKVDALKTWEINDNEFIMDTTQATMKISYIKKDIIRLQVSRNKNFEAIQTVADKKFKNEKFNLAKAINGWQMLNKDFKVTIEKEPFEIKIYNDCIKEALSTIYTNIQCEDSFCSAIKFQLQPNERIYSLGRHNIVNLKKGGYHTHYCGEISAQKRNEVANPPLMVSSRGYGIILTSFSVKQGVVELYIVCRSKITEIKKGYEEVTGKKPACDKLIMQFVKYRNRYINESKLFTIVKTCSVPKKHVSFVL